MSHQTTLYETHKSLGAHMVQFGEWLMPLHYGSQIEEHHRVRKNVGMFDVSHMLVVDIAGSQAPEFLGYLLANSIHKLLRPGRAIYSCMLNDNAGIVDDLIVYWVKDGLYRLVVNAGTREKDVTWITQHATAYKVAVVPRPDLGILAVQGPKAVATVIAELIAEKEYIRITQLQRFHACSVPLLTGTSCYIGRTGYTGEDGFELILPTQELVSVWNILHAAGVTPAGLGARDTLRLEAGMPLYGQDMDETVTPDESGLSFSVDMRNERTFIGKDALLAQRKTHSAKQMIGLALVGKGILRNGQSATAHCGEGSVLSGTFSPTLGYSIGFARFPAGALGAVHVCIRNQHIPVRAVKFPFVRNGKPCTENGCA